MFRRIFLSVLISKTIFVASSDNGFLKTVSLKNNNTHAKQTNANVISKLLERKDVPISTLHYISQSNDKEDDQTTDVVLRKEVNAQQTVIFKKILGRWISLMNNKIKIQMPLLKANELHGQSTNVLPLLAALNILRQGGSVDEPSLKNLEQLPKMKQNVINNTNVPSSEEEHNQLSTNTENKLLRETDSINPLSPKIKVNTESTTATTENMFQNWGLLIFNSNKNKLIEDEHDQLESELQNEKKQPEANSQTLLESAEVDDDRNKVLTQNVASWYDKLLFRRELGNLGVSPGMGNTLRLRRNLQSALAALSQNSQLSEWQRFHAEDYRKQSKWRRQLLSQSSMPQAVEYRRLLSFWRKELRRQLQIKWNRRPLVEISPGAFKSDIYVNPPDDLAKHMKKLLELKNKQEEKNRDLNAKNENAE